MWNPDISLDKWLKLHPDLTIVLPFECSCGNVLDPIPYVSSEWIGLESSTCSCDLAESFCSGFPKNKEANNLARDSLIALHNEFLGCGEPL